jgi:IclR family pca regulon transcriptional regulator
MLIALKDDSALESYVRSVELQHLTAWSITDRTQLAAEFRKIRKQGYAIADQELEDGIRSIAVPVLTTEGRPVAAVNVVTSVATVPKKRLTDEFLPILRAAALELRAVVRNI